MMNRKKHSVTAFHTVLQVHVPDKPMQTMQRIQGMHTAKEAKNVFFFIVNSLFSSAFLFLSGLTDKVILKHRETNARCSRLASSSINTTRSRYKQQSDSDVNSEMKV